MRACKTADRGSVHDRLATQPLSKTLDEPSILRIGSLSPVLYSACARLLMTAGLLTVVGCATVDEMEALQSQMRVMKQTTDTRFARLSEAVKKVDKLEEQQALLSRVLMSQEEALAAEEVFYKEKLRLLQALQTELEGGRAGLPKRILNSQPVTSMRQQRQDLDSIEESGSSKGKRSFESRPY